MVGGGGGLIALVALIVVITKKNQKRKDKVNSPNDVGNDSFFLCTLITQKFLLSQSNALAQQQLLSDQCTKNCHIVINVVELSPKDKKLVQPSPSPVEQAASPVVDNPVREYTIMPPQPEDTYMNETPTLPGSRKSQRRSCK